MDKNAIKKYAVWARRELISLVTQKAEQYEISEKKTTPEDADSIGGRLLTDIEKNQRKALIRKIEAEGFEQVMEEVAYTWFNRFTALRFMEVNNYLPSHTRVFTNDSNEFEPQILTDAIQLELDGLNLNKVYELKDANKTEELYKYLLITQCNALSSILPGMFQKIEDYTELLLPDYLLREGSVIEQMITLIPEEDWTDQVQIIGWLYQAYYSEPKDERINAHKKYKKQDIPFVTQLFTPDWIVQYMVENSLGRLWLEGHPNDALKSEWRYFLDEAEQEPEVQAQLVEIRKEYAALKPEEIRVIDPCMGSGHILCYMFDVLVQIYKSYGYSVRDAVGTIVKHNIWGLDIDDRAAQLACFSVMMKARQYDRRFFSRGIQPHVYAISESNTIDNYALEYYCNGNSELKAMLDTIIAELKNAGEIGSLLKVTEHNWSLLYARFDEIKNDISMHKEQALAILPIVQTAEALSKQYNIVVTNPPYMGSSLMPDNLKNYIYGCYPDYKSDIFAAFLIRCVDYCKNNGQIGMLTPYVWMFLAAYEKLREDINKRANISTLVQLEYNAFEAACVPVAAFTLKKCSIHSNGTYIKLSSFRGAENQAPKLLEAINNEQCGYRYIATQENFKKIPGAPVAYWVSDKLINSFSKENSLSQYGVQKSRVCTGDNNRFLRLWFEVSSSKQGYPNKWVLYPKGGSFRKWYGNFDYVINYENDGEELAGFKGAMLGDKSFHLKEGITWSSLTSGDPSFRYVPKGCICDQKGPLLFIFDRKNIPYVLGVLNSCVSNEILHIVAPTLDYIWGSVSKVPIIMNYKHRQEISSLAERNIELSKEDWNSFEYSHEFQKHPLIRSVAYISEAFSLWDAECLERFDQVKRNEERINELLINIYGLKGEFQKSVPDDKISIRKADITRDVKSLISFSIGCMFGRYSLDTPGLVYAGGEWNPNKYSSFSPDEDGILPICDDEYFEDDIVGRFVKFIETVYGKDTLEENLRFIANALGGKSLPRDVIRNYFINEYYQDHCSTYSVVGAGKRPIYWLFDSGRKNGFKCLIYMHRYKPDTIARIRTDYVHEQQSRYNTALIDIEQRASTASHTERVKLLKRLKSLKEKVEETRAYEEKIHHLADQMISIDLDDGFKENYNLFKDVLAKIK